jgi:hypothetical protein
VTIRLTERIDGDPLSCTDSTFSIPADIEKVTKMDQMDYYRTQLRDKLIILVKKQQPAPAA